LILLFAGEFASSLLRREAQLVLRPGQTLSAAQDSQHVELALIDETNPSSDRVYAISEALLQRHGELSPPALPVRLRVHQFDKAMQDDAVAGAQADVEVSDVDPLSASGGRWLLSLGQPGARFLADGRRYRLLLRPRMTPLPLSVTLERFKRQTYPGTDIPRSFSSRVLIRENGRSLERPALISMNDPLRVDGFTFYQSGYDQGGVSILQVVDNPAWSLPYLACALVSLGMLLHFLRRLSLSRAAA
ncbi:MAG: cytochrome c biogenesis protein ResB, partial [Elusimicrobia bacterium]|nr:cytochrome c biogenesis protein ResB [Elusimicrobiota bacterium]